MSNQVYSNSSKKYSGDVGINLVYASPYTVNAGAGSAVPWSGQQLVTNSNSFGFDPTFIDIEIKEDGFYCITASVGVIPASNPTTTDVDITAQWIVSRFTGGTSDTAIFGNREFGRIVTRVPARGGNQGSDIRSFYVPINMYFQKGDLLALQLLNNSGTDLSVLAGTNEETLLSIQKVF